MNVKNRSCWLGIVFVTGMVAGYAQQTYTVTTVAGGGTPASGNGDGGQSTSATMTPYGVAQDAAGNLYIADGGGNRIRKVATNGVISTVAGGGGCCSIGDNGPATSGVLSTPKGVVVDGSGNLYIADFGNGRVRKVSGSIITTYAGGGSFTVGAGAGIAATTALLNGPNGLALDPSGNLYVSDGANALQGAVYKVSTSGTMTVVAGGASNNLLNGGYGDGGQATTAALSMPSGLALDTAGNLYISDAGESRVRKVAPTGVITTFAGSNVQTYNGDGGPANAAGLSQAFGVAADSSGNVYIADSNDQRIRMVATNGMISTIAGNGTPGFSGDGSLSTNATVDNPAGIVVGNGGVIYFADEKNGRVRAMTPNATSGSAPLIKSGGIDSASAFGAFAAIAPGSWIEIYGSNLATNSRSWAGSDFNGVNAPTSLDGTKVLIGGQQAFIDYISPTQVNAQVPSNVPAGLQQVSVTTPGGTSPAYSIAVNAAQPGLLAPSSFNIGGTQYAAAVFSDGVTFVLPPGAIAGVPSRRAQPGDTITLYGIGFGTVAPGITAGQIVQQSNTLTAPLQVKFGSAVASVTYDGLAPNAVGLYQINVVVPSISSSDTVPLTFTLGGVAGTQTLYLAVQNGSLSAPVVSSLTLATATIGSGGTVTGTVTLSSAAPAGGAVVTLSSSSNAAIVPASVTVLAGATSATFTVTAGPVSATTSVTITASFGGGSASATLSVTASAPAAPFKELFLSFVLSAQGYPSSGLTPFLLTPNNGSPTFSAASGMTFTDCSASNGLLTFSCSTLSPSLQEFAALGYPTLVVTSASLQFTLNPGGSSTPGVTGSLSGSLSVTGTAFNGTVSGGAPVTISGPLSGTYQFIN
jgi:uncharacterized protein (TIGR03437 family)